MAALYSKDFWSEYDSAAEWCAKRGLKGIVGDSLPESISDNVAREIYDHREEFEQRVRDTAYGLAMEARADLKRSIRLGQQIADAAEAVFGAKP